MEFQNRFWCVILMTKTGFDTRINPRRHTVAPAVARQRRYVHRPGSGAPVGWVTRLGSACSVGFALGQAFSTLALDRDSGIRLSIKAQTPVHSEDER